MGQTKNGLFGISHRARPLTPRRARRSLQIETLEDRLMLSSVGPAQVTVNTSGFVITPDANDGPGVYDGSVLVSASDFKEDLGDVAFSAVSSEYQAAMSAWEAAETAYDAASATLEEQDPATADLGPAPTYQSFDLPFVTFSRNSAWDGIGMSNVDPSDPDPNDAAYVVNTSDPDYQDELTDLGVNTLGALLAGQDVYLFGTTVDQQGVKLSQLQEGLISSVTVEIPDANTTTTTLTSSANPSVTGQSVTFTAAVASNSPGAGTPTGSVQFAIDGVNYGDPVPLLSGTASISDANLTATGSPHTVTAIYTSSDGNFPPSTGSLQQAVVPAITTTTIASSANPSVPGQSVTFTATVTPIPPGSGTPTGSIQFAIDGANYGDPVPLTFGSAIISDAALTAEGSPYTVTAVYTNSDGNFAGSSGSLEQTVTALKPPTIQLYLTDTKYVPYGVGVVSNDVDWYADTSSRMPFEGERYGIIARLVNPNPYPIVANVSLTERYTSSPQPNEPAAIPEPPTTLQQGIVLGAAGSDDAAKEVDLGLYQHTWAWMPPQPPWEEANPINEGAAKALEKLGASKTIKEISKLAAEFAEAAADAYLLIKLNKDQTDLENAAHETATIQYTAVATASGVTGYNTGVKDATLQVSTDQIVLVQASYFTGVLGNDITDEIADKAGKLLDKWAKDFDVPLVTGESTVLKYRAKKAVEHGLTQLSEELYQKALVPNDFPGNG